MHKRLKTVTIIAMTAASLVGQAHAQDFVRPECARLVGPNSLGSQSALTARWYKRFWTGDCGGLSGCLGGSPNWNDVVGQLTARSQPSQKPLVLKKACRLGALIGLEWTQPRAVRKIDTGDLRAFKSTLDAASDVMIALDEVENQARAKIGKKAS